VGKIQVAGRTGGDVFAAVVDFYRNPTSARLWQN
jgi:hypothetical protein